MIKAENALNRKLPESYKWFLKRYAGGEVGGEEISSTRREINRSSCQN